MLQSVCLEGCHTAARWMADPCWSCRLTVRLNHLPHSVSSSWEGTPSVYTPTSPAPLRQCEPFSNVLNRSTSCVVQVLRKDEGHDKSRCFQKGILIKGASSFPSTENPHQRNMQSGSECWYFFFPFFFDFLLRQHAQEISAIWGAFASSLWWRDPENRWFLF